MMLMTYALLHGGRIECLLCGFVSHNANDVQNLYCGHCHVFHAREGLRASEELCHCGQPLHYTSAHTRLVTEWLVQTYGPKVQVFAPGGKRLLVPRHYIALHGIKGATVATLGFEEVTD